MQRGAVRASRLKAARQADAADLFRLLVESVVDYAIFLLTPDGHIASWNPGAERVKGYTSYEIIGQHFERFYPPEDRESGRPGRLLAIAREFGRVEDEGWRVRKDGTRFWADVVITALHDQAGELRGFAKITRDLTEHRQAEADRAARMAAEVAAERMERLQSATAALAAASRPEDAAEVLTEIATRRLGASGGVVALPTADAEALQVIGLRGYAARMFEPDQQVRFSEEHRLVYGWQAARALFLESRAQVVLEHPALMPLLTSLPNEAWAAIPLVINQRAVGLLWLSFEQAHVFDVEERGFLLALADVGAQALDRARLYVAEQAARTEAEAAERAARDEARLVETLHRVSLALSAELDLETVAQAVVDAATSVTGAQFGSFFYNRTDERDEEYTLHAFCGAPAEAFDGRQMPKDLPVQSYLSVPVVSKSGEVLGSLAFGHQENGVFTTRSERLALGIAAQAAIAMDNARLYQQEQQAVRIRDEFLAAAAHDLKTPLGATKGIAQLLKKRIERAAVPDGQRITAGLERIDKSVDRMAGLIDELLDLARLQMGRPLDLERQPTELVQLVRQVYAEHEPNAPRHALKIDVSNRRVVGAWDAVRLRRVIDNLVSNAIKYSPNGGDVLICIEESTTEHGRFAVLRVTDHGVGIPAGDLPHVFERFRRGGNVGFIHGTGIGLGIAQSIVHQHGGSIDVESVEGRGSTFTVRLPLG